MNNTDETGQASRRSFLKSVALAGGGIAVAAKVGPAEATVEAEAQPAPAQEGYHETPHIRDYYARAQF